jgi:bidirectional [NiFe] hydrogenase diaphorase subunit
MKLDELRRMAQAEREAQQRYPHRIHVCVAAGCLSQRSDQVIAGLVAELKRRGRQETCLVKGVGCMGLCAAGPLLAIEPRHQYYQLVSPDNPEVLAAIVDTLDGGEVPEYALSPDLPFFRRQHKIVLENSGQIDPERIEDYIAAGGYEALLEAVARRTPQQVTQEIVRSGLRGRGGAGYPTGLKWMTVAQTGNRQKYVVCNADEGDPGAFMDRSLLESDPHRVLEGMALAAYAVGADRGYLFCRAEYSLAVKRLRIAIRQAENLGLLGRALGGKGFGFSVEVRLGAGSFVSGEETAMIASIEGRRGTPQPRPPYPAQQGLWGCPTLVNNVETLANVPAILRHGAEWFAAIGSEKSKGTKLFALAGAVKNTGLIEVPLGTTLRDIVFGLGGGIPGGRRFKAVQTGGPCGGAIPEQLLDMGIDYEALAAASALMGSGGLIVMDDGACMIDVARFFLDFCRAESCGQCAPCRVGTTQLHNLLSRVAQGQGSHADLEQLERLGEVVRQGSLCGLGQSAPNALFSTLKYFRSEYLAHIERHSCAAGTCGPRAFPATPVAVAGVKAGEGSR